MDNTKGPSFLSLSGPILRALRCIALLAIAWLAGAGCRYTPPGLGFETVVMAPKPAAVSGELMAIEHDPELVIGIRFLCSPTVVDDIIQYRGFFVITDLSSVERMAPALFLKELKRKDARWDLKNPTWYSASPENTGYVYYLGVSQDRQSACVIRFSF